MEINQMIMKYTASLMVQKVKWGQHDEEIKTNNNRNFKSLIV